MEKSICLLLLLLNILNIVTTRSILQNYYWRDYEGVIPTDAVPAGHDITGKLIYIGQVLDGERLIPGKIYQNDENIYFEFEETAWSTNKNIKILCTCNSENLEWVPTTVRDIHKLREETTLIKGGYQPHFLTFIGRVHLDGRTEVGKVICRQTNCLALYVNEEGYYKEYHSFEILTYNPYNENAIEVYYVV